MNKLLDVFWLGILCLMTGFCALWAVLAIVEGAVCFGCFLIGGVVWMSRMALIPFLKGEDGGLV